ncbi:MAG TPA: type II toxin-antitoxin system prevent-host-death family antitoxin [Longimicrobium sp.]|uniref:type II toxin-antitoxin system prevent-host-death family antitoxin n=1 Tax=Longimicrobium sp. TaxID=2029185 RepID=UPI002EDABB43
MKAIIKRRYGADTGPVVMTTREARDEFSLLLKKVSRHGTVILRKHHLNKAVVMSYEQYTELTRRNPGLPTRMAARHDALFEAMQAPSARRAMRSAFAAPPEEMSKSAVSAARRPFE